MFDMETSKMLFTVRDGHWFSVLFMEDWQEVMHYVLRERGNPTDVYSVSPSTMNEVNTLLQLGGSIIREKQDLMED
jgi:hypothetical protein